MPMQLWSLEGAVEALGDLFIVDRLDSRTHERGHTKTFSCWVWAADVAHIPTKCTLWRAARGAGRVEAMLGFSPPSPTGRPAPGVRRRELLVHVDRIEDWTPCTSQSSSSHQSGLPSSGSGEERPFPAVYPGTWTRHVEDGQGRRQPPAVPPPAATACSVEAAVGTTMTTTTAAGAGAPGRTRCSDGATPTRHQWWPRIAPAEASTQSHPHQSAPRHGLPQALGCNPRHPSPAPASRALPASTPSSAPGEPQTRPRRRLLHQRRKPAPAPTSHRAWAGRARGGHRRCACCPTRFFRGGDAHVSSVDEPAPGGPLHATQLGPGMQDRSAPTHDSN
uniref:Uncharacterized protein n=1 Tax=Aegilops tauschii subsp. strangulata TaxID=200361 RepID=A0A452YE19_AEGTS